MTNKSAKIDIEDHKWLMKKKADLGYKTIGDVIHILIVREQNLERLSKRFERG